MKFIQVISGDVKEGKFAELQRWLVENEPGFAETTPEGSEYLGAFFSVYSSEREMGRLFCLHALDSYGAQDRLAQPGTAYAALLDELTDFFDQRNQARAGALLLKRVTAATLLGSEN